LVHKWFQCCFPNSQPYFLFLFFFQNIMVCQSWWVISIFSVLRKLRQEDGEF
jgi:hypothetical protein